MLGKFSQFVVTRLIQPDKLLLSWIFCSVIFLVTALQAAEPSRILVMGDSMMAWNKTLGASVAHHLKRKTNGLVRDRSRSGAVYLSRLRLLTGKRGHIPSQFQEGDWDWIVLNGGGNDLFFGCGCTACDSKMERLISSTQESGAIPRLIDRLLLTTDAKIIYTGYLRTPGRNSVIDHCAKVGAELESRISNMARSSNRLFFVSLQDLVPHGDLSYHDADRVHPSIKGSEAISARISALIK